MTKSSVLAFTLVLMPRLPALAAEVPTPPAILDAEQAHLTAADVDKLPPAQVLTLHGKSITVAELKVRREKAKVPFPRRSTAVDPKFAAQLDTLKQKLASEQNAKIAAERAREIAAFQAAKGGN